MIKFFRKIRQKSLSDNNFNKYMLYAIGEIVLVVIGILIALQINNWNEERKTRGREVAYLQNIRTDLQLTLRELDEFINTRKAQINSANRVLEHYEGKKVEDWNAFNKDIVDIYTWQRYFQNDNTFQELINSGNLALITNDSIKNGLLNLELLYKKLKYNEDHFRFDAEVTLYEPSYNMLDIKKISDNYFYQLTNGQMGELGSLEQGDFDLMLKDQKQKNGFAFATLEFSGMISRFENMKALCENMIGLIDRDLRY